MFLFCLGFASADRRCSGAVGWHVPGWELMVRKKTVPQRAFALKWIIRKPRVLKISKSASCSSSSLLRFSEGGKKNVLMGFSAEAFCTVTTLPPTEQAAVESREQLTGHQISQSLSLSNAKKLVNCLRAVPLGHCNPCNPAVRWYSFTLYEITSRNDWDCCQSPAANSVSESPQDGVCVALMVVLRGQQRHQKGVDSTAGVSFSKMT